MNRKLGAVIIAVAVAVGIYFMTAEKKIEQTACGKVTIAEMNWASAELMANVDKIILEKGYDCEVELVAGATMPTFTSMNEKGMPDFAPELWSNAVQGPLSKAKDEKSAFCCKSRTNNWFRRRLVGITKCGQKPSRTKNCYGYYRKARFISTSRR